MSDQLNKLGFRIGNPDSLVNEVVHKGGQSYDPSNQIVRKGAGLSPREILEGQLSKGGIAISAAVYKEPQLVRVSDHADEELDADDSWEKKRLAQEKKADKEFVKEKKHYANPSRGSHGEEFHTDAKEVDYDISEVDRKFDRESRPAKSKASRYDYVGDDQGEKEYTYKSDAEIGNLFLQASGEKGYTVKSDRPKGVSKREFEKVANLHENSDGVVEKKNKKLNDKACLDDYMDSKKVKKSELNDALDDLIGQIRKSDAPAHAKTAGTQASPAIDKSENGRVKVLYTEKELHQKPTGKPVVKSPDKFVKSQGMGGLVMDFGFLTGNPIADHATLLLNRHADPIQENNAKYQNNASADALTKYVTKGEDAYSREVTPFGNITDANGGDQLNKPMDQQVLEAFKKGQLDNSPSTPAVVNKFNAQEMNVGGEVIKATSETDAALLEMMKASGADLSGMPDMTGAIDATGGGAQKVILGLD